MKIFKKLSPERQKEYIQRMKRIKEANPDSYFPSDYHRTMLTIDMLAIDGMLTVEESAPWFCRSYGIPYSVQKIAGDAMIHTAALGDMDECEFLRKELWADIDRKNSEGNTPLMAAVKRKRLRVAEWLLHHGAKILPNKSGWNPVLWACRDGCIPALNMFKHYGVDFNQPYPRWQWKKGLPRKHLYYPIEIALLANQAKAVQWLFNNGVCIDDKTKKGYSIRDMFLENPGYFTQETRKILIEKIADESQQVNQNIPKQPQKHSFWQRLYPGRTKD